VAGATGRVGRHVVDILEAEGHDVVEMSRSRGVDIITGEALAEALSGVEAIVDAATGPSPEEQAATEFFTTAARNLHEAGQRAGVQRIVVVSIIGADRLSGGYGAAKVAHEQATLPADLATGPAAAASSEAQILEIAGPREESLVAMAKLLAARRGHTARIEEVSDTDDPTQVVYESGALLPGPDAILAGPTFAEWLDVAA
jgi:putative NAD(P)-binding protein